MMSKLNTEGASIGSEHDTELRLAYERQDVKNEVQSPDLFVNSNEQEEEKVDTETKHIESDSVRDSTANARIIKFVYSKRGGKNSTGAAENNSTPPSTGVPMTGTNGLAQTSVQGKASNANQFHHTILLGENLHLWAAKFALPSAESSLASLYGESNRNSSVEFAVKVLMGETPLPMEAAEVEEFFRQKMSSAKSRK